MADDIVRMFGVGHRDEHPLKMFHGPAACIPLPQQDLLILPDRREWNVYIAFALRLG